MGGSTIDPNGDEDNDGLSNAIEDSNGNGIQDPGETDWQNPDTDSDGINDGCEDANADGILDSGETNPLEADSDMDGLSDGAECSGVTAPMCPDLTNVMDCPTDPTLADTDSDGLDDPIERNSDYGNGLTSDPRNPDTDGDCVLDGTEDANQDGAFDPLSGESHPLVPDYFEPSLCPNMAPPPTCIDQRPPLMIESNSADIRFAHPLTIAASAVTSPLNFQEIWSLDHVGQGDVAGFILSKPADIGVNTAAEQAQREASRLGATIVESNNFTTWDGGDANLSILQVDVTINALSTYRDLFLSSLSEAPAGTLQGLPVSPISTVVNNSVEIHILTIYRGPVQVIEVAALLANDTAPAEASLAVARSLTDGTGLAKFADQLAVDSTNAPQRNCDTFDLSNLPMVDFLFVIDDTGSMGPYQAAMVNAAQRIFDVANNPFIDARWTINSTEVTVANGTMGEQTQCGLLNSPQGPNGTIWSTFDPANQAAFECRVRDPIGIQNCDPSGTQFFGVLEFGLVCAKWAIDHIQGRRGMVATGNEQRPGSDLVVILVTDEYAYVSRGFDRTTAFTMPDDTELLTFFGQPDWASVTPAVVGQAFINYFLTTATSMPFGSMVPVFIYNQQDMLDRDGYFEVIDQTPNSYPLSFSLDINLCANNPQCAEIPNFMENVFATILNTSLSLTPQNVPITASGRITVDRITTGNRVAFETLGLSSWFYDPRSGQIGFGGNLLLEAGDVFHLSYHYWQPPPAMP